jgi:hypothetical protein
VPFSRGTRKTGAETACFPAKTAIFLPKSDIYHPISAVLIFFIPLFSGWAAWRLKQ